MNLIVLFRTSVRTLSKHKARSFLTILGIMIGICAIIVTFSIGRGAEEAVSSQIMSMGENAVYIMPSSFIKHGALKGNINTTKLRVRDVIAIEKQASEVQEISPMHMTAQGIEYRGKTAQQNIIGCYINMPRIDNNKLKSGAYFNQSDVKNRRNVIILGQKPADELFENIDPIGQIVLISGNPFKVIGVLEKKPHYFGPRDPNEQAFIPYTTSKKLFQQVNESFDEVTAIAMKLNRGVNAPVFRRKLGNILRFSHNLRSDEKLPFVIFDTQTLIDVARQAASVIRLFGLFAACISLIVGSIGVMNIMLVSVKERTKEIGLRMAIGATQKLIRWQFLIESMALCFIGGIIGIILGIALQFGISYGTSLATYIELLPLVISLLVTIAIGMFFGYYPARQASLLNPVDALLQR